MGWIFHFDGSLRRYVTGPRASLILNGPKRLGASLTLGCWSRRFLPSNHTWSPGLNVGNSVPYLSCASFMALSEISWLEDTSSRIFLIWSSRFCASGAEGVIGVMVKRGVYPMRTSNGDFRVVAWTLLL